MDLGLGGRVVVVTGSSRGIGKAAALLFAKEGARVAITYHHEREKALAVIDEIARAGGEAVALALDLASSDSIRGAMHEVVERWGSIDVLVNNAVAWGARGPWEAPRFEDLPEAEWTALLRANAEGHYVAIQAALPSMRAKGWGRIVNVSSGLAVDGMPGSGPYVEPVRARLARRALAALSDPAKPIRVDALASALGVSDRHLRRAFSETVGIGPKTFARMARLHRALARMHGTATWTAIAADAGYYDQAHMIAEFRALVGTTPAAFAREAAAHMRW